MNSFYGYMWTRLIMTIWYFRSRNVSESVANVASETKPLFKKLLKIENGTSTSQERSHINDLNEIFKIKIVEVPRFGKKVHPAKVLKNTSKYAGMKNSFLK